MGQIVIDRIQVKRGTAARWTELNYPLRTGEFGFETDTNKFKIGDGFTPWNDLDYFIDEDQIGIMIANAIAQAGVGSSDPRIGVMTDLTTTEQGTVVGAINEVNQPNDLVLRYANAKA